ncbi:MAG: hypothetical protein R2838_04895 [Caldilineaceae bacterium]
MPPQLAEIATREGRKLQFSGVHYRPPAPDGWRALLAPADTGGNQVLWVVRNPASPGGSGTILGFMLNARAGILQMFASETIAAGASRRPTPSAASCRSMTAAEVSRWPCSRSPSMWGGNWCCVPRRSIGTVRPWRRSPAS